VHADSLAGELMYPISWREMKCPKTGEVEERKTAKPI
jgi:exosome complex component CSL4